MILDPFRYATAGPSPVLLSVTPTSVNTAALAHNVAMPAGTVNAGDLLIALLCPRGASGVVPSTPSGWTQLLAQFSGGTNVTLGVVMYKVATGTEGGTTVNFATNVNTTMAAQVWRIQAGTYSSTPTVSGHSGSSNTTPDPPSHASGWGGLNVLWIAGFGSNGSAAPTAWPYASNQQQTLADSGGSLPCRMLACTTTSTAGTLDPPNFTMAAATNSAAFTIAVSP
jgi:hypothetical protein